MAVTRGKQQAGRFGFELIRGLNIGSIARLVTACGAYFWASWSQHILLIARCGEIWTFFTIWAVGIVAALIWRDHKDWLVQLVAGALLFKRV
ncbi:MAG: hypothetical protein GY897_05235 [Alteromonas sp.]|nr:hypothetical protein [Alteromonas sp.]